MKRLSKVMMAIGIILAMLFVCCADSPDIYGYFSCAAAIFGVFMAVVGYILTERRSSECNIKITEM